MHKTKCSSAPFSKASHSLCRELRVSASYLLPVILFDPEIGEMDELQRLWRSATPKQIKLISSMIQSALQNMEE